MFMCSNACTLLICGQITNYIEVHPPVTHAKNFTSINIQLRASKSLQPGNNLLNYATTRIFILNSKSICNKKLLGSFGNLKRSCKKKTILTIEINSLTFQKLLYK